MSHLCGIVDAGFGEAFNSMSVQIHNKTPFNKSDMERILLSLPFVEILVVL